MARIKQMSLDEKYVALDSHDGTATIWDVSEEPFKLV